MSPVDYAEALRSCTENGADPEVLFGAAEEIERLRAIESATRNYVQRNGRNNIDPDYQKLVEVLR